MKGTGAGRGERQGREHWQVEFSIFVSEGTVQKEERSQRQEPLFFFGRIGPILKGSSAVFEPARSITGLGRTEGVLRGF